MTASSQTIFDQRHYQQLIEARAATIRRLVLQLAPTLQLSTALDAGCGIGFFSEVLRECGLDVVGFDGRRNNVDEAKRRYPLISFRDGDIQNEGIRNMGHFDLVLCFGLLYHLENPLAAIRNLYALTKRGLLLESMCLPGNEPWMLLRQEQSFDDQSLTDVAFYGTEPCLVKMLYRAGFRAVYRTTELPDHDDFRDTPEHSRRRTILFATSDQLNLISFSYMPEPAEPEDPWINPEFKKKGQTSQRIRQFLAKPVDQKLTIVKRKITSLVTRKPPNMITLPFGAQWLTEGSALDDNLLSGTFEKAELRFVERFLKQTMTVLDIGAHHGIYTLLSSRLVGRRGKVIAFEPSPRERVRLERHIRLNKCKNVRIEQTALGSSQGQAELFLVEGKEDYCNSMRPPAVNAPTRKIPIEVNTLDYFLRRAALEHVDFIKLDVEGAELSVLMGATSLLSRSRRPVFMIEVYDIRTKPWGYPAREIVQFLAQRDYNWFALENTGKPVPIDPVSHPLDANLVAVPGQLVQTFAESVTMQP